MNAVAGGIPEATRVTRLSLANQCPMTRALVCLAACVAVAAAGIPSSIDHSNWMRDMMPVIANATVMDLSIPGTHDSMTVDLSTYVSDGANDIPPDLSDFLHLFGNFFDLGEYMRNQVGSGRGGCKRVA